MSLWCIGVAHGWYISKEQDGEYLVEKVCIKEFVDKEFVDREEFVEKKFVVKEFVAKEFVFKEFVDKDFVNKVLLMSLGYEYGTQERGKRVSSRQSKTTGWEWNGLRLGAVS